MVALEHSLIILLLLVGLLQARQKLPAAARWGAVGVLALAFVVPTRHVALPWEWLAALVIPVLLWQAARLLASARWSADRRDLGLWLVTVGGIAAALALTAALPLMGTLLYGLLAASIAWRAAEEEQGATPLGQIGPVALVFLLAEIAPAVEAPGRYALALVGGAALGSLVGYLSMRAALAMPHARGRNLVSISQVYLAYGMAWLFDLSSVTAALFAVILYVAYGTRCRLWPNGVISPRPLDERPLYCLAVLALAFFAWQTHVPLSLVLALQVALSLTVVGIVAFVGRAVRSRTFATSRSTLQVVVRVAALLIPALLLWPRGVLINPAPLALALLAAAAATLVVHLTLTPLLSLYAWLEEAGATVDHPEGTLTGPRVADVMTRDIALVAPQTPVPDLARELLQSQTGCVLVIEGDGRLVGIVTESDLFVQLRRLPRGGQTYPALFREPVKLERLPETYAQLGAKSTASDVMTPKVIWVKESQSAASAIRLMALHGLRRLPVVDYDPAAGGKPVGVITRGDIIRWLSRVEGQASGDQGRNG